MELKITSVQHYTTKKDGSPLIDKRGKPYQRAVIKTEQTGTEFVSGFVYEPLKEGQVIEANVIDDTYNGKLQKKFSIISKARQENTKVETALIYLSKNVDSSLATGQMILSELKMLVKRLEAKGVLDLIDVGTRRITPQLRDDMAASPSKYLSTTPPAGEETDEFPPLDVYEQ